MASGQTRDAFFDNAKAILITLVVIGHVLNMYVGYIDRVSGNGLIIEDVRQFMYLFHMPMFLFISGLFAKKLCTPERGLRVDSLTYYLLLYFIMYCLLFFTRCLYDEPSFNPFMMKHASWYLFAITAFGASTAIISKVKLGWKLVIPASIAVSFFSGFTSQFDEFLSLGRIVNFAPFYFAGYFMDAAWLREKIGGLQKKKYPIVLAVLVLVAIVVVLYVLTPYRFHKTLFYLGTGHYSYAVCNKYVSQLLVGCMRLFWFALVPVIAFCVFLLVPTKRTFLSSVGEKTLQVYMLHPVVYYLLDGFGFFEAYVEMGVPLSGLWVVVFSIALTAVLALPNFPAKFFGWLKSKVHV